MLALLIALVWMVPQVTAAQPGDSQAAPIYVVRHAERADADGTGTTATANMVSREDPLLSAAGTDRAERLANMLRDAAISRVFATEFVRTRQTAEPVAKRANVEVTVVPARDMATLVQKLLEPGGPTLVVGHSNTVPEVLKALGVSEPIQIGNTEYDNLFIVIRGGGAARLLKLKY